MFILIGSFLLGLGVATRTPIVGIVGVGMFFMPRKF